MVLFEPVLWGAEDGQRLLLDLGRVPAEVDLALAVLEVEGLLHDEERRVDGWIFAGEHAHRGSHFYPVVVGN